MSTVEPKQMPSSESDDMEVINMWVNGTHSGSAYRVSKFLRRRFFAYGIFKNPSVLATVLGTSSEDLFYNEAILPQFTAGKIVDLDIILPRSKGEEPVEGILYYNLPRNWEDLVDPIEPASLYMRGWVYAGIQGEYHDQPLYTQAYCPSRQVFNQWRQRETVVEFEEGGN